MTPEDAWLALETVGLGLILIGVWGILMRLYTYRRPTKESPEPVYLLAALARTDEAREHDPSNPDLLEIHERLTSGIRACGIKDPDGYA